MNLAPETITIEAQRNTELLLLDYLRSTNPHIYALWSHHPDHGNTEEDTDSSDASTAPCNTASLLAEQAAAEASCFQYAETRFHRAAHAEYASTHIGELPTTLQGLYPARPWVAYWCLQAADLLGTVESDLLVRTPAADIAAFLFSCLSHDTTCEAEVTATDTAGGTSSSLESPAPQSPADSDAGSATESAERPIVGFAGGPRHLGPHLAASYAACCALAVLAGHDDGASLRRLPRAAIKRWLLTLRNDTDGSFRVHGGGESDIRASYCAAVITSLLSLDDPTTFDSAAQRRRCGSENSGDAPCEYVADVQYEPVLTPQTARFVAACQTHEGGFTCSSTASEAHGAYTQCGLAALLLMKQPHLVHQPALRRWLAARQLNCEGGFNGRTNKLVDSCYSHWIGASHVLLRTVEAYTKCFTPVTAPDGGASSLLCAKEVVLLDHAQLLDAKLIQATENTAWDQAEAEQAKRVGLVDRFLSADDACLGEATRKQATASALYDAIFTASITVRAASEEGSDDADAQIDAFHQRQAFLYGDVGDYYFNQRKLQDYVLRCCQDAEIGGLMDKPGTAHDAYHTCYSLSGMSAAQNLQYLAHASAAAPSDITTSSYLTRAFAESYLPKRSATASYGVVLSIPGPSPAAETAVLRTTSPIFNIRQPCVLAALKVWGLKTFL